MSSGLTGSGVTMTSQGGGVRGHSMSSGLTGWGRGMIDLFSVSRDSAFLMSATQRRTSRTSDRFNTVVEHVHEEPIDLKKKYLREITQGLE